MKRLLALLLTLLCAVGTASAEPEKYEAMPAIFAVTVEENERKIDEGSAYVYKEYVTTTNPDINAELRAIVDAYDREFSPTLQPDPRKRGKRGSVLNISTVYYRTGEKYLSTLTIARVSYEEQQLSTAFTTHTWDLETGRRLTLADLFEDDAWETISEGVRAHLTDIFPGESRDSAAIDRLCTPEALASADFTLSGMELTLHYAAGDIVPGKVTLTHARFFYPDLRALMTETGLAATDNGRWKMVAVTFDDGPKDYPSTYTLDALRKIGARGTYFIVGKQLERYGYVLQSSTTRTTSSAPTPSITGAAAPSSRTRAGSRSWPSAPNGRCRWWARKRRCSARRAAPTPRGWNPGCPCPSSSGAWIPTTTPAKAPSASSTPSATR